MRLLRGICDEGERFFPPCMADPARRREVPIAVDDHCLFLPVRSLSERPLADDCPCDYGRTSSAEEIDSAAVAISFGRKVGSRQSSIHCRRRRIAAHAYAAGAATIVTANADQFKRIRQKVENRFASRAPRL